MAKTYTGGCACGAIRYEVSDEAVFQNHCQCIDCQSRSGTARGHSWDRLDLALKKFEKIPA
jgi:hypothetical protein